MLCNFAPQFIIKFQIIKKKMMLQKVAVSMNLSLPVINLKRLTSSLTYKDATKLYFSIDTVSQTYWKNLIFSKMCLICLRIVVFCPVVQETSQRFIYV